MKRGGGKKNPHSRLSLATEQLFFSNVAEAVRMTNALVHMVGPLKYSGMDDTGETLK